MSNDAQPSIRVRVGETRQLFNSMDPSPFFERDLDPDCEQFIVSWAREIRHEKPLRIEIHFEREPLPGDLGLELAAAVRGHFEREAALQALELRELARQGRTSLMIGLVVLAACMLVATLVPGDTLGAFANVVAESLIVAGWVAMWHPLEVLLYGLWPVRRKRRLLERLAAAEVTLTSAVTTPPLTRETG